MLFNDDPHVTTKKIPSSICKIPVIGQQQNQIFKKFMII